VSSSPPYCRAPPLAADAMTTLQHLGGRRRGRPRHVAPVDRGAGDIAAPRRLGRQILIGGDALLPRLPPLVAVVVAIALGDLTFLMLRLTCSASLLRRSLVLVEDCLLRERRLGRDKVGAFQLPQQERIKVKSEKTSHDKRRMKLAEKTDNLQISLSPRWGASAMAATSRLLS
jgi:hypothetical protein